MRWLDSRHNQWHWAVTLFLLLQSILASIVFPILLPSLRLVYFAPLQAFLFIRAPLNFSLWISLFIGLFLDCSTTSLPFSVHTIVCSVMTLLLHGRKKHFFEEKIFSWVLYSSLISFLYTALLFFCTLIAGTPLPLSLRSFFSDMVIMAFIDGIYTLVWFTLPMYMMTRIKQLFLRMQKGGHEEHEIPFES